jgi:hypothetical protein
MEMPGLSSAFRYLATALVLNVALWLSILYQVYDIENYYTNRSFYESIGWLVIMGIPVGILLFAVWCQKPKLVERGIEKFTSVKRCMFLRYNPQD